MVNMMDRAERIERIKELQREADEARARIAERVAARENDPYAPREMLTADQRLTEEPDDLIFTESIDNNELVTAASSDADDWRDTVARAIGKIVAHERLLMRKELAARDARIAKLEAQVETLIALVGQEKSLHGRRKR